jgi:hypothetical protein
MIARGRETVEYTRISLPGVFNGERWKVVFPQPHHKASGSE